MRRIYSKKISPTTKKEILKTIWSGAQNQNRFSKPKRTLFTILTQITIFLIFLILATWLGLRFTQPNNQAENVQLNIDYPQEIENFQEVSLKISFQNTDRFPLASSRLNLYLPLGFQIAETSLPSDEGTNNQWTFGSLNPREEKNLVIKGRVIAPLNSPLNFQAILTYKPHNFNAEFQKVKEFSLVPKSIPLTLDVWSDTETEKILVGTKINFQYKIKNISQDLNFPDLTLKFSWPDAFSLESSKPNLTNENTLIIPSLKPQEEFQVNLRGSFSSEAQGDYQLIAQVLTSVSNQELVVAENSLPLKVIKSDLVLRLFVNELNEPQIVKPGEALTIRLDLDNQSQNTYQNLSFGLQTDNALLDWPSLTGSQPGNIQNNTMIWDQSILEELANFAPQTKLSLKFNIKILPLPEKTNYKIKAFLKTSKMNGQPLDLFLQSQEISLQVVSNLKILSSARYFNDQKIPIGFGPLPPQVGQETHYQIIWQITNDLHNLSDIKVTADLPNYVRFEKIKSLEGGEINFNPESRTIEWKISSLPTNIKKVSAQFEIVLIPKAEDRGSVLLLLGETVAQAKDQDAQAMVAARSPSLTTNLDYDPFAQGQGVVQ